MSEETRNFHENKSAETSKRLGQNNYNRRTKLKEIAFTCRNERTCWYFGVYLQNSLHLYNSAL